METSNYDERVCICTLNRVFGFEPKLGIRLIDYFGCASGVFEHPDETARLLEYSAKYLPFLTDESLEQSRLELNRLQELGCRFTGINEDGYPPLLKEIADPPLGLYFRGTSPVEEVLGRIPAIAIIGTRDLTEYGREWCWKIVEAFSRCKTKPLVVSGFALGVDIAAHQAALRYGLPTVGVLPTGIDDVYPYQHRGMAEKVSQTPGCGMITDYPPGTVPLKINFLRRNRIIAGMSRATIIVESKEKGGGMMTARLAWSYERDVFALPGRLDDVRSGGCNVLIGEKIADPIFSLDALSEALQLGGADAAASEEDLRRRVLDTFRETYGQETASQMADIAQAIRKRRQLTVEEIAVETGLDYQTARSHTSIMELEGLIGIDLLQRCSLRRK